MISETNAAFFTVYDVMRTFINLLTKIFRNKFDVW